MFGIQAAVELECCWRNRKNLDARGAEMTFSIVYAAPNGPSKAVKMSARSIELNLMKLSEIFLLEMRREMLLRRAVVIYGLFVPFPGRSHSSRKIPLEVTSDPQFYVESLPEKKYCFCIENSESFCVFASKEVNRNVD